MNFTEKFIHVYKALLPSPFTIAIVLSFFVFILTYFLGDVPPSPSKVYTILTYWQKGLFSSPLLAFSVQMMLMLVLGHILALSAPINHLINQLISPLSSTPIAAVVIAFSTMLVGLFNWGLGLVFGAIFARKMAERARQNNWAINYPLLAACGYAGMLVWHGGLSGSSLAKITEPGHLQSLSQQVSPPSVILYQDTVFSPMNITTTLLLLFGVPLVMYFVAKNTASSPIQLPPVHSPSTIEPTRVTGAEKIDYARWMGILTGGVILIFLGYQMYDVGFFKFFTLNRINLMLFGWAILFHGTFHNFLSAADEAISGATGILIQFPFYFGIMGMMSESGLIAKLSTTLSTWATPESLGFLTFIGAGLVNILVPSGGGQWAIQGGLIVETAMHMHANLSKTILAFAYGDELTNMLQPFWALPLLGITQLKAKQILPYTLILFLTGLVIFSATLWIF